MDLNLETSYYELTDLPWTFLHSGKYLVHGLHFLTFTPSFVRVKKINFRFQILRLLPTQIIQIFSIKFRLLAATCCQNISSQQKTRHSHFPQTEIMTLMYQVHEARFKKWHFKQMSPNYNFLNEQFQQFLTLQTNCFINLNHELYLIQSNKVSTTLFYRKIINFISQLLLPFHLMKQSNVSFK